ncbi:MAG: peptide/nickel transport system permease protein [Thermoanaerobaculia bacterium]|jgi:peptide/nickel transport system permease protein|nr:peptide/nickel transport system permease protein [Thermoanaerobaculia bacterium]
MLTYVVRRLLYGVLTFFGITIAIFVLIHSVPGDPISFYVGMHGASGLSRTVLDEIRHEHHLDQSIPKQYGWWLRGIVTLDFGTSFVDHRRVTERIAEKLPNTFILNLLAFLIAALIGVPIGLWSAARSGRPVERASAVGFFLLYSLPSFWVALLLMELFSVRFHIFPLFGMTSDDYLDLGVAAKLADRAKHLILPVVTLAYAQLAIYARFSKSALTEVIRQDFITTARAKGACSASVLWHHALRNALIPLITLLGLTLPYLVSGSVIVEEIFQWDGIGRLYFDAISSRDYPTVLGLSVATAVATLVASLLADVLYAIADPRIRLGGR